MDDPLVCVVTPTWHRHEMLLTRCIPSVQAQTYPHVQHIVISDGPDEVLRDQVPEDVVYGELAYHDDTARWGHWARLAGIDAAEADLIAYLDDDNAFRQTHIECLVDALTTNSADFAYGQMQVHIGTSQTYRIGTDPPTYGHIDTSAILHYRKLLERENWRPSLPTIDWDLVRRWMIAGATWAYVPEVTVDYFK